MAELGAGRDTQFLGRGIRIIVHIAASVSSNDLWWQRLFPIIRLLKDTRCNTSSSFVIRLLKELVLVQMRNLSGWTYMSYEFVCRRCIFACSAFDSFLYGAGSVLVLFCVFLFVRDAQLYDASFFSRSPRCRVIFLV